MKIQYVDHVLPDVEDRVRKGHEHYETGHGIAIGYKKFSLVMRGDADELIGVLTAFTVFAEIYIDDIWVDEAFRCKGYGRDLLEDLERLFKGKGYNNINLVTSKFQAPDFYRKCGFQEEFVRENKQNPKLTKYFFIKYFNERVETQGIIRIPSVSFPGVRVTNSAIVTTPRSAAKSTSTSAKATHGMSS